MSSSEGQKPSVSNVDRLSYVDVREASRSCHPVSNSNKLTSLKVGAFYLSHFDSIGRIVRVRDIDSARVYGFPFICHSLLDDINIISSKRWSFEVIDASPSAISRMTSALSFSATAFLAFTGFSILRRFLKSSEDSHA